MNTKQFIICLLLTPTLTFAKLTTTKTTFNKLPNWQKNNFTKSLNTFKNSCNALLPQKQIKNFGTKAFPVNKSTLKKVCAKANTLKKPTQQQAKQFFEKNFKVVEIKRNQNPYGLFTAYYLPLIKASKTKSQTYSVPIYARPTNLITAKLGMFRLSLKGKKIAGYIANNRLYPYNITRKQINNGALKQKATALLYAKSRADRFFLQIQGSGIAILPNGKKVILGYDGATNANYYPIGRWLVKKGYISRKDISLQSIHQWLNKHPKRGIWLMNKNKSFVFFKKLPGQHVFGTNKIPLTAYYSLAVDNNTIPLGLPVYLSTTLPSAKKSTPPSRFNRLMIAQDTGGAIVGAVRGDVYLGEGKRAAIIAGHMRSRGKFWVLLPRAS